MPETVTREQLAAQAATRRAGLGAPDSAREDWRYVRLKDVHALEPDTARSDLAHEIVTAFPDDQVILVDGLLAADGGLELRREPDAEDLALLQAAIDDGEQADLMTAGADAGFISIDLRGLRETPLRIVNLLTGGEPCSRIHLRARAGSTSDVCITTVHLGRARTHLGIAISVERGATLRIDELDAGKPTAIGVNQVSKRATIAAAGSLRITTALVGGVLQRHAARVDLVEARSEVSLGGSSVVTGDGQAHHLVRLHHRSGQARSRQAFKAVADQRGLAGFDGLIHVDHGADETDALQQSNNLQLSPTARIATRPQLDIFTDDVVASHGATIGQVDPEELYYLRTRGLDPNTARALIVEGFLREGLEGMGALREEAEAALIELLHS